ncbi:hypothetical protein SGCZBJ_11235 [Caulobacter zeae]|uniref:TIGR02588 family protein n=1 Tax=Caulobacter zeae TaxID=2055137 RepID=A0A2N5DHP4_9CAUL|nr:hypothetical protein [Caulobacter zeae]PLR25614.1 hypothetical protein SGCZBJ_11235 [Caulobacter zeae]
MATATKSRRAAKPSPRSEPPLLEWISAAIGLVCALAAIGFVGWDALLGERSPPAIEVRLVAVTPTPHGYVAQVEAINHGGSSAAQVAIEGVLSGQGEAETAQATLDYIPQRSRVGGGLVFEHDPRAGRLVLRARGFADAS